MATPDRINSHIEIAIDGTASVTFTLIFGNGDKISSSCAAETPDGIQAAGRQALRVAYALAEMLPVELEE